MQAWCDPQEVQRRAPQSKQERTAKKSLQQAHLTLQEECARERQTVQRVSIWVSVVTVSRIRFGFYGAMSLAVTFAA